ncbi:MAG: V/A-type H+/Na+-transporting ATPase subunit [Tepidanaerobacteraceae bacterium]|nr:V/A-type H+/Na+-transporting ATPase subunit [Tepidanaerobacteraceae bacterium]
MGRELEFLYVSSRIKALETALLGKSTIDRLLEAQGPEEALKVLSDTDYGADMAEMENVYDFEKVLEKSLKRTFKTISDSIKDSRFVRFFTLKNDYHNLKVIIKNKILGLEGQEYFSNLGEVPTDELKKLVLEDVTASVPESIKRAYQQAIQVYEETQDPQQIDFILDYMLFEELAELVEGTKENFFKEYFTAMVDLINIRTTLRLMQMKADFRILEKSFLPGGSIKKEILLKLSNEPVQNMIDAFASSPYGGVVEAGISSWINNGSPAVYEKLADDYLLNLARRGLYKPYGPETVVGYLAARENETKILRIILVGKINGISSEMIKERLRDVYV